MSRKKIIFLKFNVKQVANTQNPTGPTKKEVRSERRRNVIGKVVSLLPLILQFFAKAQPKSHYNYKNSDIYGKTSHPK